MECRWQVELDPYCQRVLAKHWPAVPKFGDIRELTGAELEPVDLICGGFPCQPFSVAGKRKGTADARWLWPDYLRIVRLVRPAWVLVENVPGLLSIGEGRVFAGILRDLAESGFDAEWDGLPAAAVGAPHLRYRVFIVAHSEHAERRTIRAGGYERDGQAAGRQETPGGVGAQSSDGGDGALADTQSRGEGQLSVRQRRSQQATGHLDRGSETGSHTDCAPPGCWDDGVRSAFREGSPTLGNQVRSGDWWAVEPDVGRVADGVPHRVDRLRGLGNAVVPQVAEWIGRRILAEECRT